METTYGASSVLPILVQSKSKMSPLCMPCPYISKSSISFWNVATNFSNVIARSLRYAILAPTFFRRDISLMQIRDSGSECSWCEQRYLSHNILEDFSVPSSDNLVVGFHGNRVWCKLSIAHFGPNQINNFTIMYAMPIHFQVVNLFLECSHKFLKRHSLFVTV